VPHEFVRSRFNLPHRCVAQDGQLSVRHALALPGAELTARLQGINRSELRFTVVQAMCRVLGSGRQQGSSTFRLIDLRVLAPRATPQSRDGK
jgi:hypothetical protein